MTIVKNNNIKCVEENIRVDEVEMLFDKGWNILYMTDSQGIYIGCITRKEMALSVKEQKLVVNNNSIKLKSCDSIEEKVKQLFERYNRVFNIPILDSAGKILYEYENVIETENFNSSDYWENRYKMGGNSGDGSYNKLAEFKADVLNEFVKRNKIDSVVEWGFGDGSQLSLLHIPHYIGYDVAQTAVQICKDKFYGDKSKEFLYYNGSRIDELYKADMAISLDVLYHLVEDDKFENYMSNLFNSADRYVCIYSSNYNAKQDAVHIKRRKFSDYIQNNFTDWELMEVIRNPYETSHSEFFIYRKHHCRL